MENLSREQLSELSTLLDERFIYLQLRLKRLRPMFDKNPSMLEEVKKEMELIDSINEMLWK